MQMEMVHTDVISTDTATICVFDLAAMRHRKDDAGDWWSIPADELKEVREANALFLNLGKDGAFQVEVSRVADASADGYCLSTPSRRIFIGPGEEMSGGGFEPTGEWGGFFVAVDAPYQKVSVTRHGNTIVIGLQPSQPFDNALLDLIRI